jgi:2-polyprenyl-6-methoxyphenol hydroxylase-like FAD-dependent oxidoreductase
MADELSRTNVEFIAKSFALYEKRRRRRAELAQDDSRKLAVWMAADSAPLVWTRDHFMKVATTDSLVRNIAHSLGEPI